MDKIEIEKYLQKCRRCEECKYFLGKERIGFGHCLLREELKVINHYQEKNKEIDLLKIQKNNENKDILIGNSGNTYPMKEIEVILTLKINELIDEIKKIKEEYKCKK